MKIRKRIKPDPNILRSFQNFLENKLIELPRDTQNSITMTTWELLENAYKYHCKHKIRKAIKFELTINKFIRLSIQNYLKEISDSDELIHSIDRIQSSHKPQDLYLARMKEILDKRVKNESKLGLLKIRCEGDFFLGYNLEGKKLRVIAEKLSTLEDTNNMEPLHHMDLSIICTRSKELVHIIWKGKSRDLSPEKVLDGYLGSLIEELKDSRVIVDFTSLLTMNSSTIPPLLSFIKSLEEERIPSYIIYDNSEQWQNASFLPLTVLTSSFRFAKIKAKSQLSGPILSVFDQ